MTKLSAQELKQWEASRDMGAEIIAGLDEARSAGPTPTQTPNRRPHPFKVSDIVAARAKMGLSQEKFARILGVSRRTLEGWEQGRRKPTGAAQSLLKVALERPDVLRELFADSVDA